MRGTGDAGHGVIVFIERGLKRPDDQLFGGCHRVSVSELADEHNCRDAEHDGSKNPDSHLVARVLAHAHGALESHAARQVEAEMQEHVEPVDC